MPFGGVIFGDNQEKVVRIILDSLGQVHRSDHVSILLHHVDIDGDVVHLLVFLHLMYWKWEGQSFRLERREMRYVISPTFFVLINRVLFS